MTDISLSNANPNGLKVDAVVVGVAQPPGEGRRKSRSNGKGGRRDGSPIVVAAGGAPVDKALGGRLAAMLQALGATGARDEVTKMPSGGALSAAVVVAVGLGEPEADGTFSAETLRRAAGSASRALAGTARAAFSLPAEEAPAAGAVAEGALFGAYSFGRYKTGEGKEPLGAATVVSSRAKDRGVKEAVSRAEVLSAAVRQARDWINTPPSDLTPAVFVEEASAHARTAGVTADVLDDKALRKGGYGGILGVGQGSANPPRLLRLAYRTRKAKRHVVLVGKGITFDSGGISIKPAEGMPAMKGDMGGAAAVVAAAVAAARLELPVNVTAYAPMAENMPSGSAQRPSDVLHIYGGKTVEVLNTDAEGRLVLADALVRAGEDSPDLIVDVATLTGACVVALGTRTAGIMSNDEQLLRQVHDASSRAGEAMWPLPLPRDMREKLDSPVADIANVGGERWGGALQAGLFLEEFVPDGVRWSHLDIAGPSYNNDGPWGYTPKGGTGAGIRTLVQVCEDVAAGRL